MKLPPLVAIPHTAGSHTPAALVKLVSPSGLLVAQYLDINEAEEIAKRCNAYPKLIRLLQQVASTIIGEYDPCEPPQPVQDINALLKELGE